MKVSLSIVKGVEGLAVYINDHRVCGSKPLAGGEIIKEWKDIDSEYILEALGLLKDEHM